MQNVIILASASPARRALLEQAGVAFEVVPSDVDEAEIKDELTQKNESAETIAAALADAKALEVSRQYPKRLVLGGDQILTCNGALFDKPADRAGAAVHLRTLSGTWHSLETALAIAEAGNVTWRFQTAANLKMRTLSPSFIERYLSTVGDAVLSSVGAYQLEGYGAQLFDRIEGDFFTILGLPLLPVLEQLRLRKLMPE